MLEDPSDNLCFKKLERNLSEIENLLIKVAGREYPIIERQVKVFGTILSPQCYMILEFWASMG